MKLFSLLFALALVPAVLAVPAVSSASNLAQLRAQANKANFTVAGKSHVNHKAVALPASCVSFAGTWAGSCKDEQGTTSINVTIAQNGCGEFTDGLPDLVGAVQQSSDASDKEANNSWLTLDWDKDGKNLYMVYSESGRTFGESSSYTGSIIRQISIDAKKQLVFNTQGTILGLQEGQAGSGDIQSTCTMTKK